MSTMLRLALALLLALFAAGSQSGPQQQLLTVINAVPEETLIDSFTLDDSGCGHTTAVGAGQNEAAGNGFPGQNKTLTKAKFWLANTNSATGTFVSKLYLQTGTVGSSSIPTGSALATSGSVDLATIPTSATLVEFTFTDAYAMSAGTQYVITYERGSTSTWVSGRGKTKPGGGVPDNFSYKTDGTWSASGTNTIALCFGVYGT